VQVALDFVRKQTIQGQPVSEGELKQGFLDGYEDGYYERPNKYAVY